MDMNNRKAKIEMERFIQKETGVLMEGRSAIPKNIGVPANIHMGVQTEFCPNGEHKSFVMRTRRGEKQ